MVEVKSPMREFIFILVKLKLSSQCKNTICSPAFQYWFDFKNKKAESYDSALYSEKGFFNC